MVPERLSTGAAGQRAAPGSGRYRLVMTNLQAPSTSELLTKQWLLSSDSHIIEPPDLWDGKGGALAERMPRVESLVDGDWWIVDGYKTMSFLGFQTGDRFEIEPEELRTSARFSEVRPAAYDPARYVVENEDDGVWGSVLYPSQGLVLYEVPVSDVVSAAMRVYNDWLADFCRQDPARLKGVAMVNLDDIDEAVAELERCRQRGLSGALITVAPPSWQPFRSPAYDRFWAAAQDLAMPLSLHVATDRADPRVGSAAFRLDVKEVPPSVFVNSDFQVRQSLAELIFSGVFERFPRLRVGSVEHELGWIPSTSSGSTTCTRTGRDAARRGSASTTPTPSRATSSAGTSSPPSRRTRTGCACSTSSARTCPCGAATTPTRSPPTPAAGRSSPPSWASSDPPRHRPSWRETARTSTASSLPPSCERGRGHIAADAERALATPRRARRPMKRFDGRVALVTGAASGIGRAITTRLAEEGSSVLAVDIDAEGLEKTRRDAGTEVIVPHQADLGDADACAAAVAACEERFGRLDVLGNVAGIYISSHTPEMSRDQYRRIMAINLDAYFYLAQAAIPRLLESGGNIVNIASNAGIQGVPYSAAYCMSKGGVIQLTRSLAVEYLKTPLRVNAIAPAGTNTNLALSTTFPEGIDADLARRMMGLRGMTEPEEVAAVFAFLASGEARSVTGAVYTVDHGLTVS